EDAPGKFRWRKANRADTCCIDRDHFPGGDFANKGGSRGRQGGLLGCYHPATGETTEDQWAESVSVASRIQGVLRHHHDRKRTLECCKDLGRCFLERSFVLTVQ